MDFQLLIAPSPEKYKSDIVSHNILDVLQFIVYTTKRTFLNTNLWHVRIAVKRMIYFCYFCKLKS